MQDAPWNASSIAKSRPWRNDEHTNWRMAKKSPSSWENPLNFWYCPFSEKCGTFGEQLARIGHIFDAQTLSCSTCFRMFSSLTAAQKQLNETWINLAKQTTRPFFYLRVLETASLSSLWTVPSSSWTWTLLTTPRRIDKIWDKWTLVHQTNNGDGLSNAFNLFWFAYHLVAI